MDNFRSLAFTLLGANKYIDKINNLTSLPLWCVHNNSWRLLIANGQIAYSIRIPDWSIQIQCKLKYREIVPLTIISIICLIPGSYLISSGNGEGSKRPTIVRIYVITSNISARIWKTLFYNVERDEKGRTDTFNNNRPHQNCNFQPTSEDHEYIANELEWIGD